MGAFASAAQAQSSVTVYGILDVGFAGTTSRSTSNPSAPNAIANFATQPVIRTNTTGFSGGGSESTSRLGFRGTEDLGGGTSAFFTAEFALNPTDQNLSGNANGGLFNRQTFVGLKKNGIGETAIGTQYTPIHLAVGATDPGQQNNMVGSIIYATSAAQGNAQTTTSYTVRQNQAITAKTEDLAGFVLSAMYVNNNRDSTQYAAGSNTGVSQGGTTNSSGFGVGANFTLQKFYATAAYQSFKNETDNANAFGVYSAGAVPSDPARIIVGAAGATVSGNGLGTVTQNGTNITDNQTYGAATYDFGILKAYANYINRKATLTTNSASYLQRSGQQLGVRSFITPTIEAWASAGNGRYTALGVANPTANFTAYQLGTNYLLSKRTNLYAIYGATQVSSTGTTTNSSFGASSYGVGVRHTF